MQTNKRYFTNLVFCLALAIFSTRIIPAEASSFGYENFGWKEKMPYSCSEENTHYLPPGQGFVCRFSEMIGKTSVSPCASLSGGSFCGYGATLQEAKQRVIDHILLFQSKNCFVESYDGCRAQ